MIALSISFPRPILISSIMSDDLFSKELYQPLASRMRPDNLDNFYGQQHLIGPNRPLREVIDIGVLHSMILWGPPGVGKTTLAKIISRQTDAHFENISAVLSGVKEIRNTIPTTSTTLCLALGDALCCTVLDIKNFDKKSFRELHPGGKIGKKLKTLNEIMDKDIPIINSKATIMDAVLKMTEKKYGCAVMVDNNKKIKGIFTDGDLRRAIKTIKMDDLPGNW